MQSALFIGVDVAKDNVVVACSQETFASRTLLNKTSALKAFLVSLPPQSSIAMEATGSYHQNLADLAHRLGLRVYVLNPRDLYHYAKAMGLRAKTDRVDAALIARFLASEGARLRPYHPPHRSTTSSRPPAAPARKDRLAQNRSATDLCRGPFHPG
jgi:transposase